MAVLVCKFVGNDCEVMETQVCVCKWACGRQIVKHFDKSPI